MDLEDYLRGRLLLKSEIPDKYHRDLSKYRIKKRAINIIGQDLSCVRCGFTGRKDRWLIKKQVSSFYYCPKCLLLGRVESRGGLYGIKEKKRRERIVEFTWEGALTRAQKQISEALINSYQVRQSHLVYAVTGAGKTEMLFPLIHKTLQKGCRIAIVSPRVDVCLELYPRFTSAFQKEDIMLLYGNQKEDYRYTHFVVATTHQLWRFYKAFDVVVVDEVDAYPYANNPFLAYGVKTSLKKDGVLIYLTATPSKDLMKLGERKALGVSYLPKRYHGHALPVPRCFFDYFLNQELAKMKLPRCLKKILSHQERSCLIFFPNIKRMKKCYRLLCQEFPRKKIAYVYAGKKDRESLVNKMRLGEIDWLLCTTILERGVTFPNIDVIVFEANHRTFTIASLVQISGRVGRKKEFPTGSIYFLHTGKSRAMKKCLAQIKEMNLKGGFI